MRELAAFYAVAALFGFIYAGTMPLYSVLVRENFPLRMMGTVIGGTAMAGSLGMATGPVAGGLIYDTFASYAWLYIGSWAVGLGAFLIALTFRPFPKTESGTSSGEAQPAPMSGVKPNRDGCASSFEQAGLDAQIQRENASPAGRLAEAFEHLGQGAAYGAQLRRNQFSKACRGARLRVSRIRIRRPSSGSATRAIRWSLVMRSMIRRRCGVE